ncbi:MAG: hypothetical protein ABF899_01480 [Oenococcus sp.]|uniref:hypothetical protein n=1 Tax=Oenococcus sp. TaxID=1979414 RepID=UPI0039EA7A75
MTEVIKEALEKAPFKNRVYGAMAINGWSIQDLANKIARFKGRSSLSISYTRDAIYGKTGKSYDETRTIIKGLLGI